jgi:Tfp pilus assembly protein PilF
MSSNCEDLIKDSKFFAQKELGRALKASEVSKYWFLKSLAFIKNSPLQFIRLFLRKVALFWDAFEIPDVQDYYFAKSQSRFLKIPFWSFVVIAPLSLLGMLLAIRDCKRLFLPYSFIIAYVCSVALYFVNSRYRLPAIPVLIIFASFSLWWFSVKFGKKEYIRLILALMVLVSLFVLTNRRHITLNFSDSYNNTGDIFRREGRLEEAALYYEKAIMANPNNAKAYNDLGFVYLTQGRLDEASRMFHKSMEIEPQNPRALNNLGLISFRGGENVAAIEQFKKAIDLSPGLSEAHNNLGVAYAEISAYEEAIQEFKESVAINPNDLAARYNLGLLYAKKGLIQEAINEANNILLLAPDHGGAKELLAILKAGDTPSNPSTEPVLP